MGEFWGRDGFGVLGEMINVGWSRVRESELVRGGIVEVGRGYVIFNFYFECYVKL